MAAGGPSHFVGAFPCQSSAGAHREAHACGRSFPLRGFLPFSGASFRRDTLRGRWPREGLPTSWAPSLFGSQCLPRPSASQCVGSDSGIFHDSAKEIKKKETCRVIRQVSFHIQCHHIRLSFRGWNKYASAHIFCVKATSRQLLCTLSRPGRLSAES